MGFLSKLHDGHANVSFALRGQRTLPVSAQWIGDHVHVLAALDPTFDFLKHKELTSIGGVRMPDLEKRVNAFMSADLGAPRRNRKPQFGSSFLMTVESMLTRLGVARGDSIDVSYVDGGRERTARLPLIEVTPAQAQPSAPLARNAVTRHARANFFTTQGESSTIYAQFSDLSSKIEPAFFERLFAEARDRGARFLVVDLRDLSGGDAEALLELFRYVITQPRRCHLYRSWQRAGESNEMVFDGLLRLEPVAEALRFHGQVILFVGTNTFSAGTFPVVFALDNGLATVIGEPCGNSSARYGMVERVKLPHSNLTFQYSTRVWERARPGAGGAQRPIEPDVRIVPTLEDHLRGRDPVWDYFVATYAKPR